MLNETASVNKIITKQMRRGERLGASFLEFLQSTIVTF